MDEQSCIRRVRDSLPVSRNMELVVLTSPYFHSELVLVSSSIKGQQMAELRIYSSCFFFFFTVPLGAFDYDFGALDNLDNPLTKSYTDLVYSTLGAPSPGQLLFINTCDHIPSRVLRYLLESATDPALQKARENRGYAHRVARELIQQKRQEVAAGQSERDVLSLLGACRHSPGREEMRLNGRSAVKANDSQDEQSRLQDDEIVAQVRTLMLAGHDTVSKTVSNPSSGNSVY